MQDYQKMYTTLFNAITDAIGALQETQQAAEELYLSATQPDITEKPDSNGEDKI